MTHRSLMLAGLVLALGVCAARAAELAPVHGVKTVGAMTFETRGVAISAADIVRQGGFAAAGAARWTRTPVRAIQAGAF